MGAPFQGDSPKPAPVIPVTSGGAVYYLNPSSGANPDVTTTTSQSFSTNPATAFAPTPMQVGPSATPQNTPNLTVQDLAQLLASSRKDHLPEWKLAQFNGDPLQWHEWFGQFQSAIDSAPLTDDVKLTYLKTVGLGTQWSTTIDLGPILDMLQSCY